MQSCPVCHAGIALGDRYCRHCGKALAGEVVPRREAILEAVGVSARRLLRCEDWRAEMSGVLARLGVATEVSRAYLFENHPGADGGLRTSQRYEWTGPGVEAQLDNPHLQDLGYEESGFGRWREVLAAERDLSGVVADFPPDEQELLRAQGIRSLAVVPIFVGERWFGWMGFDDCVHDRSWTRAEIEALRAAADAVAAAIERARTAAALREREEQLVLAQKMEAVGRLAGGVAHDFNNLLTAITGYAELMLGSLELQDSPLRADCEEILAAADRAAALTRQLLAFGRRQTIEPRRVDVGKAIDKVRGMLERIIGENVRLFTAVSAELPTVVIDPGQLEQVLVNLVVNARDAMPSGGRIEIQTRVVTLGEGTSWRLAPGRYVDVTVRDTGEGIPDEIRERIFEPFFTTRGGSGTGLGLATVYGIVDQSGGEIRVEDTGREGTTFRILLPWRDEGPDDVATARPAAVAARGALSGKRILLVEDREQVRNLISTVLRRDGCEVLEAETVRQAEDHLQAASVDLLLADIVLPDGSGRELAERLRGRRPDQPVILISGYDEQRAGGNVDEWPIRFDYLAKPFSPAALVQQVVRSLAAGG